MPSPDVEHSDVDEDKAHERTIVPELSLVCIEHPCMIKNVDAGIRSLGGTKAIDALRYKNDKSLPVSVALRPDDPFALRIRSSTASVDSVLLKVTLPRWTGRKRKRGTSGPFTVSGKDVDSSNESVSLPPPSAQQLTRMLRDNVGKYQVQPIAHIKKAIRFRDLPDFQFVASDVPLMREVASKLIAPTITSLQSFVVDKSVAPKPDAALIPPPVGTAFTQHTNYLYEHNPATVTSATDTGDVVTVNRQAARKRDVYAVSSDIEEVPQGPPESLPLLTECTRFLQQAVKNLAELLKDRPIVTRRVAMNLIDWGSETLFKDATQYVGYSFRSGPWRDALVAYGLDPRKDKKYRIYQTLFFQTVFRDAASQAASRTNDAPNKRIRPDHYRKDTSESQTPAHVFDGTSITRNGKAWQVCDVIDPVLKGLFDTSVLREKCDLDSWGFYYNGTMSCARIIMRDKIHLMLRGYNPSVFDDVYQRLAALPPVIDESTMSDYTFVTGRSSSIIDVKAQELSTLIRSLSKSDGYRSRGLQQGRHAGKARPGWHASRKGKDDAKGEQTLDATEQRDLQHDDDDDDDDDTEGMSDDVSGDEEL